MEKAQIYVNKSLSIDDFDKGYLAVKDGKITRELSAKEISGIYPDVNVGLFANGMLDALRGDNSRFLGRI